MAPTARSIEEIEYSFPANIVFLLLWQSSARA